jgi:hypothetical protein
MILRYIDMEKGNMEKQLAGFVAAGEITISVLTDTILRESDLLQLSRSGSG